MDCDGRQKPDVIWRDGSIPISAQARNPEVWQEELLAEVGRRTCAGDTCASYTSAGVARRRLAAAGFEVSRAPGFGAKRRMTRGRRRL